MAVKKNLPIDKEESIDNKAEVFENTLKKEKERLIKAELRRLKNIFKEMDANHFAVVLPLIETAAFTRVCMQELQDTINAKGYTETYKNGQNQNGVKKCTEVDIYNTMSKNFTAAIKILVDLAPDKKAAKSKLQMMMSDE